MTNAPLALALLLASASTTLAQLNAFQLRSKYGDPVARETFTIRPGIEMAVDYGASKQVCRIQLPSGMRYVGTVPEGAVSKQQIDEVLNEMLPPSIRGKQLGEMASTTGLARVSVMDYEHVSIAELFAGDIAKGITVTFKDDSCPSRVAP